MYFLTRQVKRPTSKMKGTVLSKKTIFDFLLINDYQQMRTTQQDLFSFFVNYILPLFLFFLLFLPAGQGQSFESDYSVLKCQAPIPESILTTAALKSEQNIEDQVKKKERLRDRKKKQTFIIQTNYLLDQLLRSNLLLFNTPLNDMVRNTARQILKDSPETLAQLNFYIIKSSAVNAFASDRGDIFITMGLLARLNSEAELGFILAHEIVHFQEKHNMDTFIEYEAINDEHQRFREMSDELLRKSNYSQSLELEADEKGLKLFSKSGYDTNAIPLVFNALRFAHIPVFKQPIDKGIFELEYIKIDSSNWVTKVPAMEPLSDLDEYSTHPNINKRIDNVKEKAIDLSNGDPALFIVHSEEHFNSLITQAQFEIIEILLLEGQYDKSLYHIANLKKMYPNNAFLDKSFAYGLYLIGQYSLTVELDDLDEATNSDAPVQGQWNKVFTLFNKMTRKKKAILAAAHCWETFQKYPDDEKIKLMAKDMLEDLVIYEIEKPFEFFKERLNDSTLVDNNLPLDNMAFLPYLSDNTFREHLENGKKYLARWEDQISYNKTLEGRKAKQKEEREKRRNGLSLGAENLIVVNPIYLAGKASLKRVEIDYIGSETEQKKLKEYVLSISEELDLPTQILDNSQLSSSDDIATYNDIQLIDSWSNEFYTHPDYIVSIMHNEAIDLCDKYGVDHFASLGVIAFKYNLSLQTFATFVLATRGVGLLTYIIPATMPGAIYLTFRKTNEVYYFMNMFNMRTYEKELEDYNRMKLKSKGEVIKTNLYWSLNQIKRKK